MRLFIAVNFNPMVKNQLDQLTSMLKMETRSGNFTSKDNFHITLAFIGETKRMDLVQHAMNQTMEEITQENFFIHLQKIGRFHRSEGDIYWVGVQDNELLKQINQVLTKYLRSEGFQIEEREFKPHLTLGRKVIFKENGEEKDKLLQLLAKKAEMKTLVEGISLMKSERINGQLVYTEVYGCTFGQT